jgi:hypothetical protein
VARADAGLDADDRHQIKNRDANDLDVSDDTPMADLIGDDNNGNDPFFVWSAQKCQARNGQ